MDSVEEVSAKPCLAAALAQGLTEVTAALATVKGWWDALANCFSPSALTPTRCAWGTTTTRSLLSPGTTTTTTTLTRIWAATHLRCQTATVTELTTTRNAVCLECTGIRADCSECVASTRRPSTNVQWFVLKMGTTTVESRTAARDPWKQFIFALHSSKRSTRRLPPKCHLQVCMSKKRRGQRL